MTVSAPAEQIARLNVRYRGVGRPLLFEEPSEVGSGTSYAAAMLTAAAALWIAVHRDRIDALKAAGEGWKVVEAFRAALARTALVPDNWDAANYGAGILDMAALVQEPFDDALAGIAPAPKAIDEA